MRKLFIIGYFQNRLASIFLFIISSNQFGGKYTETIMRARPFLGKYFFLTNLDIELFIELLDMVKFCGSFSIKREKIRQRRWLREKITEEIQKERGNEREKIKENVKGRTER